MGVTTLLAYAFSLMSNDKRSMIFRRSIVTNYYFFESFVEESIQFGRAIVLLDDHNNIAAVRLAQDMCDRYKNVNGEREDNKEGSAHDHMPLRMKELYDFVEDQFY